MNTVITLASLAALGVCSGVTSGIVLLAAMAIAGSRKRTGGAE